MAMAMARRPTNPSMRTSESRAAPFASSFRFKISFASLPTHCSHFVGNFSCPVEVQRAIPTLKMAYGDSMHRVLHVGPDTCSVVSRLLKEKDTEAWGVESYDVEDAICIGNWITWLRNISTGLFLN